MATHPLHFKIGARTLKTLISLTIIASVYSLIGRNACFACIGAVFGMGNTIRDGANAGGNRFIGTLVGGLIAIPFYWFYHRETALFIPTWIYLPFGVLMLILICQFFHIGGGIHPGSVMFFVTLYTVPETAYISYIIARIIDTGVGVLLSLTINRLWPSPFEHHDEDADALAVDVNV